MRASLFAVNDLAQFVPAINVFVHLVLVFVSLSTDCMDALYEGAFAHLDPTAR